MIVEIFSYKEGAQGGSAASRRSYQFLIVCHEPHPLTPEPEQGGRVGPWRALIGPAAFPFNHQIQARH
jgi:hypothetical protein